MSKKLTIGFLLGKVDETGGIPRVTSIVSDALVQKGQYEIHLFSFHPSKMDGGFHWNEQLLVHDLLDRPKSMARGLSQALKGLRHKIDTHALDILVVCGFNMGLLGVLSSQYKKTKLVYWSHSSFRGYRVPFKNLNEQLASYFANAVVTLTKADRRTYLKKTKAKKVVQIYNPLDRVILKLDNGYSINSKKILSVGRLDESKNFHSLTLDVAQKIFDECPDHEWHIYGSGDFKEYIREKISEKKLDGKVVLKGHSNDIYSLYAQYSLFVMTSSFEGFPMVLLEAMASNLPLLSFDVPTGPNEIIRNDENGYLIPAFDCDKMAEKIVSLLKNNEKRRELSEANKKFVNELSIDKISDSWVRLFEELTE
ncbi:glycosyltransferase family 4 protein [Allomuricauda sp. SCSIO 65647]|uniref:glycosyltransferase family 4 protein n=1 Tax=Allomuricauda sp. SCSIO 65647 TaxID=2908843 RepID=UPI001F3D3755|nr:glycosyltransferase family 4 protein [Muricauda sp. SCSIO 65647]UJH67030.1 glycosyltransferase family 4 protein [Muricauda sp. SCSIO 65647]